MWQVFDLDGTLVGLETRALMRARLLVWRPWLLAAWWSAKKESKQAEKLLLADVVPLRVDLLPFNPLVVNAVRAAQLRGDRTVLATASAEALARSVAVYLGGFDVVLASGRDVNMAAEAKARSIVAVTAGEAFVYWGNSRADIPCWDLATGGYAVEGRTDLIDVMALRPELERVRGVRRRVRLCAAMKLLLDRPRDPHVSPGRTPSSTPC